MKVLLIVMLSVLVMQGTPTRTMMIGGVRIPIGALCAHAQHLVAQEGNPGHVEPPAGWTCTPSGWRKDGKATNEKPCACHRECKEYPGGEDENGNSYPPSVGVQEDPQCSVYCFQKSCACELHHCD